MTITRNVNGVDHTIELTGRELFFAYCEQQRLFDRDDCGELIEGLTDDQILDTYGVSKDVFLSLLGDMAVEMRRNIDERDMGWSEARHAAAAYVIKHKEEYT